MRFINIFFDFLFNLISLVVRSFPFSFPLLIAIFWFINLPVHALPADQLPADKKPAQSCQLYGLNYDPNSNGPNEYRDCQPIAVYTHYHPSAIPQYFSIGQACGGTLKQTPTGYEEAKYSNGKVFLVSQTDSYHQFQYRYPCVYSDGSIHPSAYGTTQNAYVYKRNAYSYLCPPTGHPEYDQLVESDEGQKYCLKSGPDNQCEEKSGQSAGQSVYLAHPATGVTSPICKDGCAVNPSGVNVCLPWESANFPSGSLVRCLGETVFSGDLCPAPVSPDDPAPQDGETTDGEKAPPTNTDEECVLALNPATGKKECQSVSTSNNPGSKSCGYINGVWSCVDNADGGSKTTTTNKEQTQQTDPETGNTTTTDKTTETVTTCKGADCKTTTATTTTTTVTNPSGGVIGSVSSCTGDGCGADAPGGEGSLPDQPALPDVSELADAIDQFDLQARADIEAELSKQYGDNGETVLTTSALPFSDLLPSQTSCTNPVFTTSYGSVTLDICSIAPLVNLILSFICGVLTAIHVLGVLYETAKQTGA